MKTILITMIAFATSLPLYAKDEDASVKFLSMCASCHVATSSVQLAPPLYAVKDHVIKAYPDRQDFIEQVVEWVEEPSRDISLMPGAINKFGLMPKLGFAKEDVRQIAGYIYDEELLPSQEYKKHYKKNHQPR